MTPLILNKHTNLSTKQKRVKHTKENPNIHLTCFNMHLNKVATLDMVASISSNGVLLQATKNKTYTPKNICSSASKDRSHGEYLA